MRLLTNKVFNQHTRILPKEFERGAVIELAPATAIKVLKEIYGWGHESYDLQAELDKAFSRGLIPWQAQVA